MENTKTADLFNDVMGPIMCGPSSSSTAGPTRIGRLTYDLCGQGDYKKVVIEYSSHTGYSHGRGSGTTKGVTGGLMGWMPDHENLFYSLDVAKERGLDIPVVITEDPVPHVNTITLKCSLNNGMDISTRMISMGGGSVAVYQIDDLRVDLFGGRYEVVVWGDSAAQAAAQALLGQAPVAQNDHLAVFSREEEADIDAVRNLSGVRYASQLYPVVPCVTRDDAQAPFTTAAGMQAWQAEHGGSILDAAFAYQSGISGWDQKRIMDWSLHLLDVMDQSVQAGLDNDGRGFFCVRPVSHALKELHEKKKFLDTGILGVATVAATAVMESNMSMRLVIAAPTGGSAGVFPGVAAALAEAGYTREQIAESLLVAALVGAFIYNQATFTASVGGCAVEIGAASSMSAAAAAYLLGGDTKVCLDAAGLALRNLTGLACDPLASGVEVPCIHRNAMGSANAIVSANMALGGVDPVLPYDEVIEAMYVFGKNCVDNNWACGRIGRVGAQGTATGQRVREEFSRKAPMD